MMIVEVVEELLEGKRLLRDFLQPLNGEDRRHALVTCAAQSVSASVSLFSSSDATE